MLQLSGSDSANFSLQCYLIEVKPASYNMFNCVIQIQQECYLCVLSIARDYFANVLHYFIF